MTVNPVNDAPTAVSDGPFVIDEDMAVTFTGAQLVGNDIDPDLAYGDVVSVNSVGSRTGGVVVRNADGSVTFTPDADYTGPASFVYRVKDSAGATSANLATVSVTVKPVNDAPTAVSDSFTVIKDMAHTFTGAQLVGNDTDPDLAYGDVLSVETVWVPAGGGAAVLNADGSVTYAPAVDDFGSGRFAYRVKDSAGAVSAGGAWVTVEVVPPLFRAADWLWNPISADAALAADSETWVNYLSEPGEQHVANLHQYGVTLVPASEITSSTPRYDVAFTKPWGSDPFGTSTVAIPAGTKIPPGSDGHIAVLDPTTGQAFGIWQAKYNSTTDMWSGSWGGATPLDGNGVDQTGSATATALSRYAGVVTAAEFSDAVDNNTGINHALVFSTDIAGPDFVGPAIKSDGSNIAGVAIPIPEGARVQLDPSIDIDAIPGITEGEKVIAKTLQTHGAYVGDQGSARMAFMFESVPDATSTNPGAVYVDAGLAWDYYDMQNIPWSMLRVIAN